MNNHNYDEHRCDYAVVNLTVSCNKLHAFDLPKIINSKESLIQEAVFLGSAVFLWFTKKNQL